MTSSMSGGKNGHLCNAGRCPSCGKIWFLSRRAAKHGARAHSMHNKAAYRCPARPDMWHFGSLPTSVKHGEISREDIEPPIPRPYPRRKNTSTGNTET